MKKFLITSVFLFVASISICQEVFPGKVIKVSDGDTMTLLSTGNKQIKVRLHGIDCPESKQDFGTKAKQYTSQLAYGKMVNLKVKYTDRYGRRVGVVSLPDGRVLNEELLRAGLAWHFKRYDKSVKYADLENQAKTRRLGIWSVRNPVAPWEFRRAKRK